MRAIFDMIFALTVLLKLHNILIHSSKQKKNNSFFDNWIFSLYNALNLQEKSINCQSLKQLIQRRI